MKRTASIFLLAGTLLNPGIVLARAPLLNKYNNNATLGITSTYMDYQESENAIFLDSVTGGSYGAELRIRKTINRFVITPSASFTKGKLLYTGGLIGDPSSKLKRNTDNFFFNTDIQIGYIFDVKEDLIVIPYLDYGYRRWDREVPPVGQVEINNTPIGIGINGYTEEYSQQFLTGGLRVEKVYDHNTVISAYGAAGLTINPHLFTNLPTTFGTAGLDQDLQSRPLFQTGVEMMWQYHNYNMTGGLDYTYFKFGKSKVNGIGYFEPDSRTHSLKVSIGVGVNIA